MKLVWSFIVPSYSYWLSSPNLPGVTSNYGKFLDYVEQNFGPTSNAQTRNDDAGKKFGSALSHYGYSPRTHGLYSSAPSKDKKSQANFISSVDGFLQEKEDLIGQLSKIPSLNSLGPAAGVSSVAKTSVKVNTENKFNKNQWLAPNMGSHDQFMDYINEVIATHQNQANDEKHDFEPAFMSNDELLKYVHEIIQEKLGMLGPKFSLKENSDRPSLTNYSSQPATTKSNSSGGNSIFYNENIFGLPDGDWPISNIQTSPSQYSYPAIQLKSATPADYDRPVSLRAAIQRAYLGAVSLTQRLDPATYTTPCYLACLPEIDRLLEKLSLFEDLVESSLQTAEPYPEKWPEGNSYFYQNLQPQANIINWSNQPLVTSSRSNPFSTSISTKTTTKVQHNTGHHSQDHPKNDLYGNAIRQANDIIQDKISLLREKINGAKVPDNQSARDMHNLLINQVTKRYPKYTPSK